MSVIEDRLLAIERQGGILYNKVQRIQRRDDLDVACAYLRRLLADHTVKLAALLVQADLLETQMNATEARM